METSYQLQQLPLLSATSNSALLTFIQGWIPRQIAWLFNFSTPHFKKKAILRQSPFMVFQNITCSTSHIDNPESNNRASSAIRHLLSFNFPGYNEFIETKLISFSDSSGVRAHTSDNIREHLRFCPSANVSLAQINSHKNPREKVRILIYKGILL